MSGARSLRSLDRRRHCMAVSLGRGTFDARYLLLMAQAGLFSERVRDGGSLYRCGQAQASTDGED